MRCGTDWVRYNAGVRLFIAIELDESHRTAITRWQDGVRPRCDGVRWIPLVQLHLTVKFLGDVRDQDVLDLSHAIRRASTVSGPFELRVSGCGCFPPRGAVRIVWVGAKEESGVLRRLVEAVEDECESAGFPREAKPFSPHITIGRVRDDRSGGKLRAIVEAGSLPERVQSVKMLSLMESVLAPKGPTYTSIGRFALGVADEGNGKDV